ncbi:MAG: helix-turn-helix domain-containing protein [Bacteroidota bacterium]|jgi:transcriptional regulator with XRE-family HTH domain
MELDSLGTHIRLLREAKSYSQEYVAIQLGITQQAYSAIEKKPEKATLQRLKEIAIILQVPLITLLGEDEVVIQQNFNQAGGNAGTILKNIYTSNDVVDRLVSELKDEINFLRTALLEKKE